MSENVISPAPDMSAVRARRASLRRVSGRVAELLAASAAMPPAGGPAELMAAANELLWVWHSHVESTERSGGVLQQLVDDAPRLALRVRRLRDEHAQVAQRLQLADDGLRLLSAESVEAAQRHLAEALTVIGRHRREGGELLYQAYQVDLGSGE
jgi:hypothetical protein